MRKNNKEENKNDNFLRKYNFEVYRKYHRNPYFLRKLGNYDILSSINELVSEVVLQDMISVERTKRTFLSCSLP